MMSTRRDGSALIVVLIVAVLIAGVVAAYYSIVSAQHAAAFRASESEAAFVIAESGLDVSLAELNASLDAGGDGLGAAQGELGRGTYAVTVTPPYSGPGRYTLKSVGTRGGERRAVQAVVTPERAAANLFSVAAFADYELVLDGNVLVDSYDSAAGWYDAQARSTLGRYRYANAKGHVAGNGRIVLRGNSVVLGNATPGVQGTVELDGNARVMGSTAPATAPVRLPPIEVPSDPVQGSFEIRGNDSGFLAPGRYHYSSFVLDSNATVRVTGPVVLIADRFELNSNAVMSVDGANGSLTIYVTGDFQLESGARLESLGVRPGRIAIYVTTDNIADPNQRVQIDSNAVLAGTLYAPNARLRLDSNATTYGALAASVLHLANNVGIHYDESLGPIVTPARYIVRSWEEVPP